MNILKKCYNQKLGVYGRVCYDTTLSLFFCLYTLMRQFIFSLSFLFHSILFLHCSINVHDIIESNKHTNGIYTDRIVAIKDSFYNMLMNILSHYSNYYSIYIPDIKCVHYTIRIIRLNVYGNNKRRQYTINNKINWYLIANRI